MALYNQIGIGRWNRFIQKLTDMKGGPPAPQLASEIQFQHDIFGGVELMYLQGWNRFATSIQVNAVAAQNSIAQIRNPAGSNILIVLEKVVLANINAAAMAFFINQGAQPANLATPENAFVCRLDARGTNLQPNALISQQNNIAAIGFTMMGIMLLPSTSFDVIFTQNQELPILPGDAIQILPNPVNAQLNASIVWRERFLEPSERT